MTLYAAIRKAELMGVTHVYRLSLPAIHRGIKTEFTPEDREQTDWQAYFGPRGAA